MKRLIYLTVVLLCLAVQPCLAKHHCTEVVGPKAEAPQPGEVVVIYVHGVLTRCDQRDQFVNTLNDFHCALRNHFANEPRGYEIPIAKQYINFYWCSPDPFGEKGISCDKDTLLLPSRKLADKEIIDTNKEHGTYALDPFTPLHDRSWWDTFLLLPGLPDLYAEFLEPYIHHGTTIRSQQVRSFIYNFFHDAAWIKNDDVRNKLFADLDSEIEKFRSVDPNRKFIFVGHSNGALISFDYLFRHKLLNGKPTIDDPAMAEARLSLFKGLITFGSELSVVEAFTLQNFDDNTKDIGRLRQHFERDKNFWVQFTERNDPLGANIPAKVADRDHTLSQPQGFVGCFVTRRRWFDYVPLLRDTKYQTTLPLAHTWYFEHGPGFMKGFDESYRAGFGLPQH